MELFPAIDLRGGTAVRLTQGDFERQRDYGDPLDLARRYVEGGAHWIHVVDLDAARTGMAHERALVREIVGVAATTGAQVQCGGGVRTEDDVAALVAAGVSRVVMGTAALESPELAAACAERWPDRVAVGLDYVLGPDGEPEALGHGWQAGTGRPMRALLDGWAGTPFAAVVATAIALDGMLAGPDIEGMRSLLGTTKLPVVASGGVSALADLAALATLSVPAADATRPPRTLAGVIVGKALVELRFTVEEAMAACALSA
jgi:phosphoribosylformimino-5-aminoimidazole carboxamide ribotide isomerase